MIKLIFTIVLLQFQFMVFGQVASDSIKAERIDSSEINGAFGKDRVYYKFKKNKTCKLIFVAPRRWVSKGTWELSHDTIICAFDHVKATGQVDTKPSVYKFIVCKRDLYLLREENGAITPVIIPKASGI